MQELQKIEVGGEEARRRSSSGDGSSSVEALVQNIRDMASGMSNTKRTSLLRRSSTSPPNLSLFISFKKRIVFLILGTSTTSKLAENCSDQRVSFQNQKSVMRREIELLRLKRV